MVQSRINGAIRDVIIGALQPNPEERATASEIADGLHNVLNDITAADAGKVNVPYQRGVLVEASTADVAVAKDVSSHKL